VKASSAASDDLIDRTIGLWQPHSQRDLSREDGRQIVENVSAFFSILHQWSRAEISRSGNDNPERTAIRGPGEVRHDR
jgi:hypothetical protein